MIDYDREVSDFEPQSSYYIQFWIDTLRKNINWIDTLRKILTELIPLEKILTELIPLEKILIFCVE